MIGHVKDLLASRRFLPIFIAQFMGAFNDNLFRTALIILITYKTDTIPDSVKPIIVTLAIGLFELPYFLFSATAGQFADKFNKARIMQIVKFAELLIIIMGVFAFVNINVYMLLFTLFLMGTHSAFFGPVKYSILPNHLKDHELIAANGLIEAGTFLSILLGMITAGVVMSGDHVNNFTVIALMISIALIGFIASLFVLDTKSTVPDLKVNHNVVTETWSLVKYVKNANSKVFLAILGISWFWLVGAFYISQLPNIASGLMRAGEDVYTFMLAVFTLGLSIGSVMCNRLLKGEISAKFVPIAAIIISLCIFDLSTLTQVQSTFEIGLWQFITSYQGIKISLNLAITALAGGLFIVPLYAYMQANSDENYRSRVVAVNNILNAMFMVAQSAVIAMLFKIGFTITQLFFVLGVANTLVAIYICRLLPEALLKTIFVTLFKLFYRVEVRGLENYKKAGKKAVIIANHSSFLDPALLATFLPDKLTFAINTYTAKVWWIKPFLKLVEARPVDPTNPLAIRMLIEEARQNKRVAIFPEGRITTTGALMKIYEGPGVIADKAGAQILPIRIDGAVYTPFSRTAKKFNIKRLFPKITITILEPRKIEVEEELKGRKRRLVTGRKLYDIMCDMMFEGGDFKKTIMESFFDARSIYGGKHHIAEDIERKPYSYNDLLLGSIVLGKKFEEITKPKEYVGMLLPSTIATILTYFGLQYYGRVPVMLNYSSGLENIHRNAQTAKLKYIITSRKFVEALKINDFEKSFEGKNVKLVYLEDIKASVGMADKIRGIFVRLLGKSYYQQYNIKHKSYDSSLPATILFTSGSEGAQKGVVLSHQNIQANVLQISTRIDLNVHDIVFNVLPLFHSFGLTAAFLLPVFNGIKSFYYPTPLHYRIIPELIYDTSATILFGTDTFLAGYAKYAHPYDFYSLRFVVAGAEKLKDRTARLWEEKYGIRIFEGYGATETSPVLSVNTPMYCRLGTVGRLLPNIKYRLEDVSGIDDGKRLYVKGPNIMMGYLLADDAGEIKPLTDGYYDTGDIVAIDSEGFVSIKGRAKRFAKIGGEMVSLTAVESYVSELWSDNMHAVIAIRDDKKGEQLLMITTKPDADKGEIISYFKQKGVSELSIPRTIKHMDKIPLLGTGKPDYVTLGKLYAA